jgi:hypothetical protein
MVPVAANLTLLNVAVAAMNWLASVVAVRFAVPSVVVVVLFIFWVAQLVPAAITAISTIPSKTDPRRILVAMANRNRQASAAPISTTRNRLGSGQLCLSGLKTELVVVTVNVTMPVGAAPLLPAALEEVCVSTSTFTVKAVLAATEVGFGVTVSDVGALVIVMVDALVLLGLKLGSPE